MKQKGVILFNKRSWLIYSLLVYYIIYIYDTVLIVYNIILQLVYNHWIVIQIGVCIYSHLIFSFCDLHIFRLSIFKFYLSLHSSCSKTPVFVILLFRNCHPLPMKETTPLRVIFCYFWGKSIIAWSVLLALPL